MRDKRWVFGVGGVLFSALQCVVYYLGVFNNFL